MPSARLTGIKVIVPATSWTDDLLNGMGDAALCAVTAHLYSARSLRDEQDFVAAYKKAFSSARAHGGRRYDAFT